MCWGVGDVGGAIDYAVEDFGGHLDQIERLAGIVRGLENGTKVPA